MGRAELKANAKQQIKGNIGMLFLIELVMGVVSGFASGIPFIGAIVVVPALSLGLVLVYLGLNRGEKPQVGTLFEGFKYFWPAFKVYFLVGLYTMLWSMLFVIPGIVKTYSYSQAAYIIAENPEMGANEAITRSREMMNGHKMELFVLQLSFIGWVLLGCITFGLAFIYVSPYMQATYVNFYHKVSSTPVVSTPNTTSFNSTL